MIAQAHNFWTAYSAFAATVDLPRLEIDPQIFEAVLDQTDGRRVNK